jgi:hypothetical protein
MKIMTAQGAFYAQTRKGAPFVRCAIRPRLWYFLHDILHIFRIVPAESADGRKEGSRGSAMTGIFDPPQGLQKPPGDRSLIASHMNGATGALCPKFLIRCRSGSAFIGRPRIECQRAHNSVYGTLVLYAKKERHLTPGKGISWCAVVSGQECGPSEGSGMAEDSGWPPPTSR